MSAEDGAKGVKGVVQKPEKNNLDGQCPCEAFLQCSSRVPYGQDVWSDPAKRADACKAISYNAEIPEPAKSGSEAIKGTKGVFRTITNELAQKVMTFPEINEASLPARVAALTGSISNAGLFKPFQKSMILRANMAKNGMVLMSDTADGSPFQKQKLFPYNRQSLGLEWNIDHVRVRARGGCNRFCNAQLLSGYDNSVVKNTDGLGCPCVNPLKSGEPVGKRTPFVYRGKAVVMFTLYKCSTFCDDKERADKGDVKHMPDAPLGTIDKYKDLCGLDNPLIAISQEDRAKLISAAANQK